MKFIISTIYLISLFSFVYGQSETKTPSPTPTPEIEEEAEKESKTEVQVTTNYEFLSKGLGTWKSMTINVRHDFSKRQVLYGFYQKAYRAEVNSDTATIGFYQPLSKKHTLLLEMSASPTHIFLPKFSGLVQIETKLSPTTFLNTGYRRTIYRDAKLNIVNAGIEKYWKSYRLTYNASLAQAENSSPSLSNRFQVDRYYGRNNSTVSADVAFGNEIVNIFTQGNVLKSNFTGFGIGGKHWFSKRFGINYKASFYQQGDFYDRGGTSIGAIFRF